MPQPGKSLLKKNNSCVKKVNKSTMDSSYDAFLTKNWNEKINSLETFASVEEALRNIEQHSTASPPQLQLELNDEKFEYLNSKNSFDLDKTPLSNAENNLSPTQE